MLPKVAARLFWNMIVASKLEATCSGVAAVRRSDYWPTSRVFRQLVDVFVMYFSIIKIVFPVPFQVSPNPTFIGGYFKQHGIGYRAW